MRRFILALALVCLSLPAMAQSVAIDLGAAGQAGATARLVQLTALVGLLSIAPSALVMVTAFTRIVIVLALLRSAIGAQGTPPNPVLVGLALFLTFFVMQPVMEASWSQGIQPMMEGRLAEIPGIQAAAEPFRRFMAAQVRDQDLSLFLDLAKLPQVAEPEQAPWRALVPAFMVSELKRAFEIGFLLFLPFLIIDLVCASLLMSLGMMMLPPSVVALPFKLIFFVLVDGWRLVAGSLVQGFAGN
ncbi:flagellar type III secretion system pore protein FliP [Acetobacteraceae bacterium H6797]|nr:flagellar type III secretion system pore protein FliP [Acetobacteraceae bacterium H6797]